MRKNTLVIFDFDNTITTRDSLIDFIIFNFGWPKFIFGLWYSSFFLFLFSIKLLPNWKAKEKIFKFFFSDIKLTEFIEMGSKYAREKLPGILNPTALTQLKKHVDVNDTVIIVSASPGYWYQDWAYRNSISRIICTKLETVNNNITGKISGQNCYGTEKVNMLRSNIDLSSYDYIIMYGDSKGDYDLIDLANEGYINFVKVK